MFCFSPVQRFTLCAAVSLTVSSRVSNSEKKLEAVRSGVRAISVSGRTPGAHVSSHTSTASQPLCPSSVQLLSFSLSVHFLQQLFFFIFVCVSHCVPLHLDRLTLSVSPLRPAPSVFTSSHLASIHIVSSLPTSRLFGRPIGPQTWRRRRPLSQPGRGVSSSPLSSVQIRRPMVPAALIGPRRQRAASAGSWCGSSL